MKKGFTLIELLAVIIILAIVALIATPIILNVVEDARISAGRSEASMIYSGINNYCATSAMEYQLNGTIDICADGVTTAEVATMVNLGNAAVTEVGYSDGKVTNLIVESNTHTFTLCGNGTFAMDDEECSVKPPEIEEPEEDYTDASGANKPEILENMIPIKYDGSNWVYADTKEAWYNYDNKEWANAVILNEDVTKNVGDTISEEEIALWYVWIPRYKYQLFNADNGSVAEQLINIEFESETATTGTVSCTDIDFVTNPTNATSETCTNASNGNWYTHPAFTFGDEEITGFWVGKFEVSTTDNTCNNSNTTDNCNKISKVTIKPGVSSWRYTSISNFFTSIQNIKSDYNISSGDSHMMKNMEWGAVAYLKQSKYGLGTTDIGINNNSSYITGCGAQTGSSESTLCNAYNTANGLLGSTTGNIYGVYDMSGGAYEHVMGNIVNNNGEFYVGESGFSSAPDIKYYDRYTYDTTNTSHGRGKLGDATKEILAAFGTVYDGAWYNDGSYLPYSSGVWFIRNGLYKDNIYAGIFYFGHSNGGSKSTSGARAVLSP